MRYIIILFLLFSFSVFGCERLDSRANSSHKNIRLYNGELVNPVNLSQEWNNPNGNLTIVNAAGENIIVSTDPSFSDLVGIEFFKFSAPYLQIDMRYYGDDKHFVKFYAITERDLILARKGELKIDPVKTSLVFISTEGGSWSPFKTELTETHQDTSVLVLNNYTDQTLKIAVRDINSEPEGLINRGATNVRIEVPDDGDMV